MATTRRGQLCGLMAIAGLLAGCGPLMFPITKTLTPEEQTSINAGWEKTLAKESHVDSQTLLDVLVTTGAYQLGVDQLTLRSEKKYSAGVVIMEISCNTATPADDRFVVTVQDLQGKVVRQERYNREQIETTMKDLFNTPRPANEVPEELALNERIEKRRQRVRELFSLDPPPATANDAAGNDEKPADALQPEKAR